MLSASIRFDAYSIPFRFIYEVDSIWECFFVPAIYYRVLRYFHRELSIQITFDIRHVVNKCAKQKACNVAKANCMGIALELEEAEAVKYRREGQNNRV